MTKEIVQLWELDAPPELVWQCLTDTNILSEWLMPNDFSPVVGHEFMFHTRPRPLPPFDGKVYCKVLEVVEGKKLSFSWKGGPGDGSISLDTIVSWTITPAGSRTNLLLEHKGFKGMKNYLAYFFMNVGWQKSIRRRLIETLKTYEATHAVN
ncbi:SRPBCC domain-containing protein [Chryseolinea sp. T2]|uniref:SRPBCC family protein n=1 Tax=Chryseolinea sp. T2 TaxID=3129255 RepID=UPI003078171F